MPNPTKRPWHHAKVPHCQTPLLSASSIVLVWKLLACENKTLLQCIEIEMDLFTQARSQGKIFPRQEPNDCSIDQ